MVYVATGRSAGTEISSTYEGRHLTFQESVLVHPSHTDGLVDRGDPVIVGSIVGVALDGATANTDLISIDSEGIWVLNVEAKDDEGNSAVAVGDMLWINRSTAVISKRRNPDTHVPFGYALSAVSAGSTAVCVVKVHWMVDDFKPLSGMVETITADGALSIFGASYLDSSDGAIAGTLADGVIPGQLKMISMQDASNSSTVSIAHHETSDPEVATFDAVDEYLLLIWTGTEWATVANTCTFV